MNWIKELPKEHPFINKSLKDIEGELWEDLVDEGLQGIYKISNMGRVKFCLTEIKKFFPKTGKTHYAKTKQSIKTLFLDTYGYVKVSLSNPEHKSKGIQKSVHRLVGKYFILNPENKPTINHKKGIKIDNRWHQLEWSTAAENNIHAYKTGLKDYRGLAKLNAKLTEKDILDIRLMYSLSISQVKIADKYKVNSSTINKVCLGQSWKHVK